MNSKIVSIPKVVPISVINEAIQFFLKEGREDDFKVDVKDHLKPEAIEYIIKNDPSSSKKYLKWIGTQVKASKGLDINGLMDNIKMFDKKIKGVDIASLKTIDDLDNKLNTRVVSNKEALRKDTKIIADTDDWLVVEPLSHESSMNYGGSTKWCISTSNEEHWDQHYTEWGHIIVMVKDRNKTPDDNMWKVALVGIDVNDFSGWTVSDKEMTHKDTMAYITSLPQNIYHKILEIFYTEVFAGDFDCNDMNLDKLFSIPKQIRGDFNCSSNKLISLKGSPEVVEGVFDCACNKLISLFGSPKSVPEDYYCDDNNLTSLVGAPKSVGGNFICANNHLLTSLKGAPEYVEMDFNCSNNPLLSSLEGAPKDVSGDFVCMGSKVKFTEEQVRAVCDVGGDVIL